jgi:ABC-type microcin C transport system permease subunit YejB
MFQYILKRLLMLPFLFLLFSVIAFALIQAPPGDFLTSYMALLASSGFLWGRNMSKPCGRCTDWISRSISSTSAGWGTFFRAIWEFRWNGIALCWT